MHRLPIPQRTLALAVAALAVAAAPGALPLLQYQREAIHDGEIWRLLTGHLPHASGNHLVWNVLPFLLLGVLFEHVLGRRYWTVLLLSGATVSLGILLLDPGIEAYVGLSGVLNGIWVAGALATARQEKVRGHRGTALLFTSCVLADLAKICIEAFGSGPIFTDPTAIGGTPVPIAHALGGLGGWIALRRFRTRRDKPAVLPAPISGSALAASA
jgi:rhomboid family GlyGly-CTERM serine protease